MYGSKKFSRPYILSIPTNWVRNNKLQIIYNERQFGKLPVSCECNYFVQTCQLEIAFVTKAFVSVSVNPKSINI